MVGGLRKLRQRFGISAPKVHVRTHVPWYLRWLLFAVLLAFSAALAAWMYDAGRRFAGFDRGEVEQELSALRREDDAMRSELARLRAIADASESKLSIERSAQTQLAQQVRSLEQDNARLREDLAIFESMLSADAGNAPALNIQRFKVERDAMPGEYRYRLLLLTGPRRDRGEFHGRMELLVSVQEGGRSAMINFPDRAEGDVTAFKLVFKHFQRIEGRFRISPKAKVNSVQVRVFEGGSGQAKATQSVALGS